MAGNQKTISSEAVFIFDRRSIKERVAVSCYKNERITTSTKLVHALSKMIKS